jgi:hypothetical protein
MMRELNNTELSWLDKLLCGDFKGCEILKEQILHEKVSVKADYAFISIKFELSKILREFPYKVRVPVEMRAYQENSVPIIFLLHVINGLIDELEVFTADLSRISSNSINLDRLEYDINVELRV